MIDDPGLMSPARALPRSKALPSGSPGVRLMVIESGSAGLAAHASTAGSEHTLALVQREEEPAAEFADRVIRRIQALGRARHNVERALLVLGPRYDADVTQARLLVARALITPAATSPGIVSELVLSASRDQRRQLQRWLPALVDVLIGVSGSGLVAISVQFGADAAPRRVMATAS